MKKCIPSFSIISVFLAIFLTGCSPLKKLTVMVQLEPDQEFFFKNTILKDFEKKTAIKVGVVDCNENDSLEGYLKKNAGKINLVNVPFERCRQLMGKGYFKPFDAFLSPEQLRSYNEKYILTSFGMVDGRPNLIPKGFETRVLVYCKSKVKDAVAKWPQFKETISAELKRYNGFGLPLSYKLEADPNKWDYYDIAVVGWIWAHTDYDGLRMPRIAHRGKKTYETALRLVDQIFQLQGDSLNVLTCKGDAVVDALYWESFYTAAGIYNKKMWENSWGATDVWAGFASGEIFMSYLPQSDAFLIHGTGHDKLKSFLKDPADLGVAVMPSACSFELDQDGMPVRTGIKSITTGSWWWAIPFNASNATLSYKLASFITDTSSQIRECERFGMIPVRKEVVNNVGSLFREPWMREIFDAAFKQVILNGSTIIPNNVNYGKIATLYIEMWYNIVVGHNWSAGSGPIPDRNYIRNVIETRYAPRASKILNGEM